MRRWRDLLTRPHRGHRVVMSTRCENRLSMPAANDQRKSLSGTPSHRSGRHSKEGMFGLLLIQQQVRLRLPKSPARAAHPIRLAAGVGTFSGGGVTGGVTGG